MGCASSGSSGQIAPANIKNISVPSCKTISLSDPSTAYRQKLNRKDLQTILVIGGNSKIVEETCKSMTGVKCLKAYPGSVSFPRQFEAVVYAFKEDKDFKDSQEIRNSFKNAPIICAIGPANKPGIKCFQPAQVAACLSYLKAEQKAISEEIVKVFYSFDDDKGGTIQTTELVSASKAMG